MSDMVIAALISASSGIFYFAVNLGYNHLRGKREREFNLLRLAKENEFKKSESLLARRLDLYSNYLHQTWDFATAFPILAAAEDYTVIPGWLDVIGEYKSGPTTQIRKTISDISLVASDEINKIIANLDSKLFETNQELTNLHLQDQNQVISKAKEARELHISLRIAMRKEIHSI